MLSSVTEFKIEEKIHTRLLLCLMALEEGFSCFPERLGGVKYKSLVSSKAVPGEYDLKFRSKFNHGYINHGCLHCAILKAYKVRDVQFFLQSEIFKILKMLECNIKITRAAC